jgi:hypothetical protein
MTVDRRKIVLDRTSLARSTLHTRIDNDWIPGKTAHRCGVPSRRKPFRMVANYRNVPTLANTLQLSSISSRWVKRRRRLNLVNSSAGMSSLRNTSTSELESFATENRFLVIFRF